MADAPNEVSASELERAARRAGGRVEWRIGDAIDAPATSTFPNGWGAARFLCELGKIDYRKPAVRETAKLLRRGVENDDRAYAERVHAFVKRAVAFQREEGEIFQSPSYTAAAGYGDCDDHARMVLALLRAGGVKSALGFLSAPGSGPRHVAAVARLGAVPTWLETTVDARFGEHPVAAAQRLGIARTDIGQNAKVTIMGDDDDDDRTPNPLDLIAMSGRAVPARGRIGQVSSASADVPDDFITRLVAAGPGAIEKAQVAMSESGLSTTAGHHAKGLLQWEPENYPGDGWDVQTDAMIRWFDRFEQGVPYRRLGDFYAAVFLPGRRLHPLDSDDPPTLTRAGESFYQSNPLLDPNRTGVINAETLEAFANRSGVVNSARWNEVRQRLIAAGAVQLGGSSLGGVGHLAAIALVAAGAAYLLSVVSPPTYAKAKREVSSIVAPIVRLI